MILHLANDLMLTSTAEAAARKSGLTYRMVPNLQRLADLITELTEIDLVLVDLQLPGLNFSQLESAMEQLPQRPRKLVAYAQHVNVDLLNQAQDSIFDAVMTRGQINGSLESLFAHVAKSKSE